MLFECQSFFSPAPASPALNCPLRSRQAWPRHIRMSPDCLLIILQSKCLPSCHLLFEVLLADNRRYKEITAAVALTADLQSDPSVHFGSWINGIYFPIESASDCNHNLRSMMDRPLKTHVRMCNSWSSDGLSPLPSLGKGSYDVCWGFFFLDLSALILTGSSKLQIILAWGKISCHFPKQWAPFFICGYKTRCVAYARGDSEHSILLFFVCAAAWLYQCCYFLPNIKLKGISKVM